MTIAVLCRSRSHPAQVVTVQRFLKDDRGWTYEKGHNFKGRSGKDAPSVELVVGGERRWRFRLECVRCGLAVTARADTIEPILERLQTNGVSEIELEALARIVS